MEKVLDVWDSDEEAGIQLRKDEEVNGSSGEAQREADNLGSERDKEHGSGLMGGDKGKEASEVVVLPRGVWNGTEGVERKCQNM